MFHEQSCLFSARVLLLVLCSIKNKKNDDMKKFCLEKEMAHDRTVWQSDNHGNV